MPVTTHTLISSQTLDSATATITFSSIPATYTNLILAVAMDRGSQINTYTSQFYFNSDTTAANYACQRLFSTSSSVVADRPTTGQLTGAWNLGGTTTYDTDIVMYAWILDYASTNKHKSVLIRVADNPGGYQGIIGSMWKSTSAVSTINWGSSSTTMPANTKISLYGVV